LPVLPSLPTRRSSDLIRGLALRPVFCRSDPPCNRGMRVKEPFHESGRCAFGEILVGELVHRRNKRLDAGKRLKSIAVGLALVETDRKSTRLNSSHVSI